MPDTVAWCVLACFRITSVFVRLGFQFLESACEFMISILHGHLTREIKGESKSKNPDVLVISSSRRRKISRNNNQRENRTTSGATSNLTDKISPRNDKCIVGNETYCSNHGRQRADYLTTRGISFNGSEIFECNLRQAKKVIVAFEFLPEEEGASSMQFVSSRTNDAAQPVIRKSDNSDVEHSENSSFQKDISKELHRGTEQCRKYPETKSDKNINDKNLASCKTRGLFKETSSEILDIETKDKEDLKLNYGEWSIDISKDDCSLNLVVQEREEVEELNPTEDIQDDPHSKLTEKVGNILQSKHINIAEDKTLQRSDTQGNEHVFSEKEIERSKPQIHGDTEEKERFGDDKAVKPKEMKLSKETMKLKISPKKSNKAFSPQILLEKSNIINQQYVNKDGFEVGKPEAIPKEKCGSDIPQGQIETGQSKKLPSKDKSFKDMAGKESKKSKPEQQKVLTETVEKSNQSYDAIRDNFVRMKVISPKACKSKQQKIVKDSKSSIKNENKNRSEKKLQILTSSDNALELEFQEHESRKAQQKIQVKEKMLQEMDHSKDLVKKSEREQQCRDFDIETTLPKHHDEDKATHLDISNLSVGTEETKYPLEKETETALSKGLPEKDSDGEQTQFEHLEKTKISEIDHENKSKNLSSSPQKERESLTNTILDKSETSLSKVNTEEECELIQLHIHPDKNISQAQVTTNEDVQQTVETDRVQENIELKRGGHCKKDDSVEDQICVEHQDEIQIKLSSKIIKESLQIKTTGNCNDQELQKGMQTDTVEPIKARDSLNATECQKNEMEETFPSESDSLDKNAPILESTTDKESSDVRKIETDNTLLPPESAISENICKETPTSHHQKDFKTNKIIDSDGDLKDDNVIRKITFSSSSSDASIETLYNDTYEKGPSIVLSEDFLRGPSPAGKPCDGKVEHSEFDINEKNTINALNKIDIKLYNKFTGNEILEEDLGSFNIDLKCDIGKIDDDYDPMREIPKYWERIRVGGNKYVLERSEIKCFIRNLDYLETQTDDNTKVGTIKDETVTSVDSLPEVKVCDLIEIFQSCEDRECDNITQSSRSNLDKRTRHVQKDRMSDDMDTSTSDESEIIPQIYSDHSLDATDIETVANSPNTKTTNSMSKLLAFELPNESIVSCSEAVSKVDKAESIFPDTPQTDEKTSEKLTSVTPENKIAGLECENIQKKETDSPNKKIDYMNDSQERSFHGDILVQNTPYIPLAPDFLLNPYDDPSKRYDVKSDIKKFEFDEEYSSDKWNRSDKIFYYNVMGRDVPEGASSISCSKNSIGEVETFHDPTLRIPYYCDGLCVINSDYVLGKREIKAYDKGQKICTEEDLKELSENTQETTCTKLKIVKVPAHSPPKRRKTSVITDACLLNKHEKLDSVQKDTDAPPEAKQESRDSPKDSPPKLDWYELTIAAEKLKGMATSSGASDDSADSPPKIG